MGFDGFPSEADLNKKKKAKENQNVVTHQGPTQRLKKVFRDAEKTHSDGIQEITDSILSSQEGLAEIARLKKETLEIGVNSGERLKVYHRHTLRWKVLEEKFEAGELTPLKK